MDSNPRTPEHKEGTALSMVTYHSGKGILEHVLILAYMLKRWWITKHQCIMGRL